MSLPDIIISVSCGVIVGLITSWVAKRFIYQTSIRILRRNIQGLISELKLDDHTPIINKSDRNKMIKRLSRIRDEIDLITGLWKETYAHRKRKAHKDGKPFPYGSKREFRQELSQ